MNTSVTSLEKSEELKERGFPQENRLFYWVHWTGTGEKKLMPHDYFVQLQDKRAYPDFGTHILAFAAPTVTEIALEMPLSARERVLRSYMHDPNEWADIYSYLNKP